MTSLEKCSLLLMLVFSVNKMFFHVSNSISLDRITNDPFLMTIWDDHSQFIQLYSDIFPIQPSTLNLQSHNFVRSIIVFFFSSLLLLLYDGQNYLYSVISAINFYRLFLLCPIISPYRKRRTFFVSKWREEASCNFCSGIFPLTPLLLLAF